MLRLITFSIEEMAHAPTMCRPASLALLTTAACTAAGPGRDAEGDDLPTGPLILAGAPEDNTSELGPLERVVPLGRDDALHLHVEAGRSLLSLWTATKGHVWKYELDPADQVPSWGVVTAGDVVVVPTIGEAVHGARGLDRATGSELWRVEHAGTPGRRIQPPRGREPRASDPEPFADADASDPEFFADADADGFVHIVTADDQVQLFSYAAATGELRGVVRQRRAHPMQFVRFGTTHVMLEEAEHLVRKYDDPRPDGLRWRVFRRGDLEPVGDLDFFGAGEFGCLIENRYYAIDWDGLVRVALDRPGLPRELLLAGQPWTLFGCDRWDDLDIIWLNGQVIGVAPGGGVEWTIDLGEWRVERDAARVQWLPDFPAVWAGTFDPDRTALLVLDLRRRQIAWVGLTSRFVGEVDHDRERTLVWRHELPDLATSVVFTVEGDTGLLGPALQVEGLDALMGTRALVDKTMWLARTTSLDEDFAGRRWPERWTRLDAATLRPLDGVSAFTLRDANLWLRRQFQLRFELPTIRPSPQPEPVEPPRVLPAHDRSRGSEPPWDRAEFDAAVRAVVKAPGDSRVWLLAWDVRAERSAHAVVALEYVDSHRGQMWMLALMRRTRENETSGADDDSQGPGAPWLVYRADPRTRPRRLLLTSRPTAGNIDRLLDGRPIWDFPGGWNSSQPLVGGNVMDGAWREVTGEAPTQFYPQEIEHPGE